MCVNGTLQAWLVAFESPFCITCCRLQQQIALITSHDLTVKHTGQDR